MPTLIFAYAVARRRNVVLLSVALLAQVVLLHGAAAGAESIARFPTAWLHAGFTNQILVTGHTTPALDARFSWPGFFSGAAVFASGVGVEPIALLRWAPLFFAMVYLLPAALLFRSLSGSWRIRWTGLWIFTSVNWVGQDYFAPQSYGLVLYLTVLAVTCAAFLSPRGGLPVRRLRDLSARLAARLRVGGMTGIQVSASPVQRATLIIVLAAAMAAIAMSHQLTPFMLFVALATLAATGRLRRPLLPVLALVITMSWISYGAVAYWTGHLDVMFGSTGQVESVVGSGISSRMIGSDVHRTVIDIRMGFSVVVWLLGAWGAVRATRKGPTGLTLAMLGFVPFGMLAVQSYGGEGVLRIFLFTSAPISLLAAHAIHDFCRAGRRVARARVAAVLALALVAMPSFLVAKYGNESFERVTRSELATVQALYKIAPKGSTLVSITPQLPWRYPRLDGYDYKPRTLTEFALDRLDLINSLMSGNAKGSYLIVTNGQLRYAEQTYGLAAGWGDEIGRQLLASGQYAVAFRNSGGVIYRYIPTTSKSTGS